MLRRYAVLAVMLTALAALMVPASAGAQSGFCDEFKEAVTEAKKQVKALTPPARKAFKKLRAAKRKLENATGDEAKSKAKAKVRKAQRKRTKTKRALDDAKSSLGAAEGRYEGRCDRGPGGGRDRGGKGPR